MTPPSNHNAWRVLELPITLLSQGVRSPRPRSRTFDPRLLQLYFARKGEPAHFQCGFDREHGVTVRPDHWAFVEAARNAGIKTAACILSGAIYEDLLTTRPDIASAIERQYTPADVLRAGDLPHRLWCVIGFARSLSASEQAVVVRDIAARLGPGEPPAEEGPTPPPEWRDNGQTLVLAIDGPGSDTEVRHAVFRLTGEWRTSLAEVHSINGTVLQPVDHREA